GLVPTVSNTRDRIDFVCNCCVCCCGVLQSVKSATRPSMAAHSNFLARVDEAACVGCGECLRRCPMEAIVQEDDLARVQPDRCIGCGVCAHFCHAEALTMVPRAERREPFENFRALVRRQFEDKIQAGRIGKD
ncbi:MAG: 4Fe-4S binding protein, partial [Proteobacteria bacterium]|nr:4Fe-4S binding protein [Pseudomonadota bacterium]